MDRTRPVMDNAKWLAYYAPFRALSVSAAYLTPFFLEKGLTLSGIFLLQSIFSAAVLLLEVPSGWFADRYGRALSLKLAAPIATAALLAYGFSDQYWQFVIWELALAAANSLISGVDTTLLYDSLREETRDEKKLSSLYTQWQRRIDAYGFYAVFVGAVMGAVLVATFGIRSTLVVDGILSLCGVYCAFRLVEVPRLNGAQEAIRLSAWQAAEQLGRNAAARWLVVLGAVLGLSTYLAFWLSAPYYSGLGIPAVLFGSILAIRNLAKGLLAHRPQWLEQRLDRAYRRPLATKTWTLERQFWLYGSLAGLVYLAMASGQLWLVWVVLGHDIVHALNKQPVTALLNASMAHEHRATLNSLVSLVQRILFTVSGPLLGWLVDAKGLAAGFIAAGIFCSGVAYLALFRLNRLRTFHNWR